MRHQLLALLAALAFVGAACSETPETTIVALGEGTDTTSIEASAEEPIEDSMEQPVEEPVEDPGNDGDIEPEPVTTLPPDITDPPVGDNPPVMPPGDFGGEWQDQPLAHTVLTDADIAQLGMGGGWSTVMTEWLSVEASTGSDELVCGQPAPSETSNIMNSLINETDDVRLDLITMPQIDGVSKANAFLDTFELLATCDDIEEDYQSLALDVIAVEIEGADRSVVVSGADTDPDFGEGLTAAVAAVDGHLFVAMIDRGQEGPVDGDVELAVAALELSISRL